ncbi:MAG: hypothetical protein ABJP45_10995 [Cyclobacteriaceae bacterium]
MKRKIQVNSQKEVDDILSTLEKSQNIFKVNSSSSAVDVEFEDRYYQFLVDKIEMLGYSKGDLVEG